MLVVLTEQSKFDWFSSLYLWNAVVRHSTFLGSYHEESSEIPSAAATLLSFLLGILWSKCWEFLASRMAAKLSTLILVSMTFFVAITALSVQILVWDDSRLKRHRFRSILIYCYHLRHLCSHWHFYQRFHQFHQQGFRSFKGLQVPLSRSPISYSSYQGIC